MPEFKQERLAVLALAANAALSFWGSTSLPSLADYDNPAYQEGCDQMSHRDFDGAISSFDKALGASNANHKAYFKRGQCFYYLQNYKLAVGDFTEAVNRDPNNSDYYLWRGTCHSKLGEDGQSIADYEQALRLNPRLIENYKSGGSAAVAEPTGKQMLEQPRGQKRPAPRNVRAIRNYEEAIRLVSTNAVAEFAPGSIFSGIIRPEFQSERSKPELRPDNLDRITSDPKSVIEQCTQNLEVTPTSAADYFTRALAWDQLQKYERALSDLNEAISMEANNAQYMLARAFIYHQQNKPSLADADIKKARALTPTLPPNIQFPAR